MRFLVRHRLLIHNNPANEWADYWGEDEQAVISTWLEWNRRGGEGWLWRYKSILRNRAVNTICHALSPRLLAWLQVKGRMMLTELHYKDVGADCRRCGFTGCARRGRKAVDTQVGAWVTLADKGKHAPTQRSRRVAGQVGIPGETAPLHPPTTSSHTPTYWVLSEDS